MFDSFVQAPVCFISLEMFVCVFICDFSEEHLHLEHSNNGV